MPRPNEGHNSQAMFDHKTRGVAVVKMHRVTKRRFLRTMVAWLAVSGAFAAAGSAAYPEELESLPVRPHAQIVITRASELRGSLANLPLYSRVHLTGTITYYDSVAGTLFLQDATGGVRVELTRPSAVHTGDLVQLEGISTKDSGVEVIKDPEIRVTGKGVVTAAPVSFAEVSSDKYRDQLVSVTGLLVAHFAEGNFHTFLINVDGHLISAHVKHRGAMNVYPSGSRLAVAGVNSVAQDGGQDDGSPASIEMRNAADLKLVSLLPSLTFERLVDLSLVFIILVLAAYVRAASAKLRARNQDVSISRSMIVARERSRILEMISSNRMLEEQLTEICKMTEELLPGAECSYDLAFDKESWDTNKKEGPATTQDDSFEIPLLDAEGHAVGKIAVLMAGSRASKADQAETHKLLSELAVLAMRQSLLFRGLVHHSNHDPLTGLPNRRLSEERLASALAEAELNSGQLAVIYVDINRFKFVNDTYGHAIGDLYLQQISARLGSQIRSMDMLARVGGDEFVVIAPFSEGIDRSYALTTRLQACFDDPFDLDVASIDGSASFGFARYPEHGKTIEELTRHADQEMYLSKENEARSSEAVHGVGIISTDELEIALLKGRFRLAYQPQFSVRGHLTGLEALIRLDDPVLGMITPDAFISVAERHPVIVDIGAWVLRSALQDAMRWELNVGEPVLMAVNVAVRQLEEPDYAKSVLALLAETGFPPDRLEIELVERSLLFSGDVITQQLKQLRDAGVRIALDDFGTGQSCLSLLHKLPIDTIKLDRRFIHAMDNEPKVLPIIQAIVSMAHSLGKRVVAEAIEHVGPVPALIRMGKMDFQGYLLSRPMPADNVHTFVQTMRSGIVMPEAFSGTTSGTISPSKPTPA